MQAEDASIIAQANKAGFITPKQARFYFESQPCVHAVRKWMKVGVHNRRVPNGQGERIKLQHLREGALWLTCVQWINEFKLACKNNHKGM